MTPNQRKTISGVWILVFHTVNKVTQDILLHQFYLKHHDGRSCHYCNGLIFAEWKVEQNRSCRKLKSQL